MKITLHKPGKNETATDLLIAGAFKSKADTKKPAKGSGKNTSFDACKTIRDLDKQLSGYLILSAHEEGFGAEEGQSYVTGTLGNLKSKAVALLGLGDPHKQTTDLFRRMGGDVFKLANKRQVKKVAFVIPEKSTVPLFDIVQSLAEGFRSASYSFAHYHTKDKKEIFVKELEIHLNAEPNAEHKMALSRAETINDGISLARDLINEGPMILNPVKFAEHAAVCAKESHLDIDVLDEKRLKKERMNLLLAVASASAPHAPPRVIRLHYKPKKPAKLKIALVGKGVMFDCGGLDIKTADGMLDMKIDMSGAAAVLGTMAIIGKLAPKVEVVGYMGCVENGVGPAAYHPGDILISRKGTSVDIVNTDAEGRLVLADTLNYATERDNPDVIIDIATLTGACMIALGYKIGGIFSNDDGLCDAICESGRAAGESFWRLPLSKPLRDAIKSPVADIKNSGDRYGSAITAALFLEEFIESGIKWAHLDIAGPASNNKPHSYLPIGGVGFSIRTLVDYIMTHN